MNPYASQPVDPNDPNDPYAAPSSAFAPPGFVPPGYTPPSYVEPGYAEPGYVPPAAASPGYGQPAYGQPPYDQPHYGQAQYGQAQYGQPPYGQSPYGQQYAPSGYPAQPGYQPGVYAPPAYPPSYYPQPSGRPGQVIAAAVLGYVVAGLLVVAALICFAGANELDNLGYPDNGFLVVGGLGNLIAAGLLIAGGVMLTAGRSTGRTLYTLGCLLDGVVAIVWLTRGSVVLFWVVLFVAPLVVGLSLGWQVTATRWLATRSPSAGGGPRPPSRR
jgi:hypothetical protein